MNYLDFVAVVGFGQQTERQRSRKTTPDRSLLSQSTYGEVPSVLAKCHNILKSIRSRTIVARGYQTLDTRQDQRQGNVNQSHVTQPIDLQWMRQSQLNQSPTVFAILILFSFVQKTKKIILSCTT